MKEGKVYGDDRDRVLYKIVQAEGTEGGAYVLACLLYVCLKWRNLPFSALIMTSTTISWLGREEFDSPHN